MIITSYSDIFGSSESGNGTVGSLKQNYEGGINIISTN